MADKELFGNSEQLNDTISRQVALGALGERPVVWSDNDDYTLGARNQYDMDRLALETVPSAQRWIPCSERLPEDDKEVLISYRYKEGEGDTSHTYIDITTYGQMYFGGNKVGNYKHWRAPFEYFESNYEVVAWMLLPEPYKETDDE